MSLPQLLKGALHLTSSSVSYTSVKQEKKREIIEKLAKLRNPGRGYVEFFVRILQLFSTFEIISN